MQSSLVNCRNKYCIVQLTLNIVPDGFGWAFVISRALTDEIARDGYSQVFTPNVTGCMLGPTMAVGIAVCETNNQQTRCGDSDLYARI